MRDVEKLKAENLELENLLLSELFNRLYVPGIKWATYINPMRSDGVFIAEDKPIEPYPDIKIRGEPYYPAIPKTVHSLGFQLSIDIANRLVALLNADRPSYEFHNKREAHGEEHYKRLQHGHARAEAEYLLEQPGALADALEAAINKHRYEPEVLCGVMQNFLNMLSLAKG
jgi:hypothetical protein